MSFGFSVGDFIAVGQQANKLYDKFIYVKRDASDDFKSLITELGLLSTNITVLGKLINDPDSTLISGDVRAEILNEMVKKMEMTLKQLEKIAEKYRKVLENQGQGQGAKASTTRKGRREWWALFRWSLDAQEVNGLRNKVCKCLVPCAEFTIFPGRKRRGVGVLGKYNFALAISR